ncbi:MAG: exodeoxyribonuclease V subunit gamma, partial [Planctomycetes bacterium]|nr:exodeoxyribonuclease V subunit gamma [Planctomycetota bacterium]
MAGGLFVHTSNRLEELLDALATVLGQAPLGVLQDDVVAVPSQGVARWLRLRLSERFGIAAGLQMPFLGAFFAGLAAKSVGVDDAPLAKDTLVFRIWRLLGDRSAARDLAPAVDYCADDPDDQKRLQLCLRLAQVFDDYQVYRPDLLQRWANGDDSRDLGPHAAWQARLWRRLLQDCGYAPNVAPPPRRGRRPSEPKGPLLFAEPLPTAPPRRDEPIRLLHLQRLLDADARTIALLPPRLAVFGACTLPPAFVDLLAACAAHVPVHLFVPEPAPLGDGGDDNPWLRTFGRQAREFAGLLADLDGRQGTSVHRFDLAAMAGRAAVRPAATLLQHLQQEVAEPTGGRTPHRLASDDRSLRVHDCHSPQRELEVVRDQILAALAADASLQPHDVFVLVPDIEAYAPIAHAVFGPVEKHLPFHVADRSPVRELPICAVLFLVLQLLQRRVEVHDLFRILEEPTVGRRFGLWPGDLPALRERCERAGIRWGIDAESRARTCRIPPFADNSWRTGLERLLLGVATGPTDDLVLGILPTADATSGRDDSLARFLAFVDVLFATVDPLNRPQTLGAWAQSLDDLVDELFAAETADEQAALAKLRTATARLRQIDAEIELRDPLSPRALQDWLAQALQESTGARG